MPLVEGGKVHRAQHQRQEAAVQRRRRQDLAGEREQHARAFDQQHRSHVLRRDVQGEHPGVGEFQDERHLVARLAVGAGLQNHLEDIGIQRSCLHVDLDRDVRRPLLQLGEDGGGTGDLEGQVLDVLGVDDQRRPLLGGGITGALATGLLVKLGEAVGIIAAQSIGEPGTQLTMRTFHTGGVAAGVFKQPQIKSKHDGVIKYNELRSVELEDGNNIVLNKNGSIQILGEDGRELEVHTIVIGAVISFKDGAKVKKGDTFVQWDPHNVPILSEKAGKVKFHDIIEGVTMKQEVDEATGEESMVVIDHKEDLHPQIIISDDKGEVVANYPIPSGAHIVVNEADKIVPGTLLAKTPRKQAKTRDITGGLPRVAELFEARRPKDASEISKIDGIADFGPSVRGKRCVLITDPVTKLQEEHLIPIGKHVIVFKGDMVKKGQQLTEGPMDPHEILEVCGAQELQEHLVGEVQEVYRLQGVTINDKHIEIIVRQMLRKVRITEPGDTQFLWGEQVDKLEFEHENEQVEKKGGKPAEATPVLLGITKASLETDSFLSAASFQDTTRVLTEAATRSKIDSLRGFKENVIMGHIIPAGTGFDRHRKVTIRPLVELPEAPEPVETEAPADSENPLLA